jgi:hypothetical protein
MTNLAYKIMIDYKKLGRLFDSADQQKLDQLINVHTDPLISQYDEQFIKHGFVEVKDNKYHLKMRDDARSVFQITKSIALDEINWLVGVISKILNDETDLKEIDLLRDRLTIEQLQHDKVSEGHKKLVGDLYKQIDEVKEDNKKLSIQIEDKLNNLRKKGLM